MILRALTIDDKAQALRAHHELAADDFEFLLSYRANVNWPDYLAVLEKERKGIDLAEGRVPATFMIAEVDGQIVGRTSIRHRLNDYLLNIGGHVGYAVRPTFRRQGYASEILRQSVDYLRELGVEQILITCDDDNVGSIGVIESQGGVLENKVSYENLLKRRYWIG